jgi:hypothetical protein
MFLMVKISRHIHINKLNLLIEYLMVVLAVNMPEEKTEEGSPAKKAAVPKGKAVLARVMLLDGSMVDISIDVSQIQ